MPLVDPGNRVAERLKHYLRARGLSQRELAEKSGYSIDLVNSIANGHMPGGRVIWDIEEVLGTPHGTLTRDDHPPISI